MKSCDMVIVVPVDGFAGKEEALRVQVWETVAELLCPELGKLYRQFNPSGSAWEHKYPRPFGVVLGQQEPEVLRKLLKAGEEAQHEAAAYHLEAMLRKADLGSAQKIGDTQFYSTVVDDSNPELLAAWGLAHSHAERCPRPGLRHLLRRAAPCIRIRGGNARGHGSCRQIRSVHSHAEPGGEGECVSSIENALCSSCVRHPKANRFSLRRGTILISSR